MAVFGKLRFGSREGRSNTSQHVRIWRFNFGGNSQRVLFVRSPRSSVHSIFFLMSIQLETRTVTTF